MEQQPDLIEENVSIEIATVTYSKSLWMILKRTRSHL
jgi:hypothetical protein